MDIKNDRKNNERLLFHGTDADSVPYVNQHGFNRSCAGKNGKEVSNLADQNKANNSLRLFIPKQCGTMVGSCIITVRIELTVFHCKGDWQPSEGRWSKF